MRDSGTGMHEMDEKYNNDLIVTFLAGNVRKMLHIECVYTDSSLNDTYLLLRQWFSTWAVAPTGGRWRISGGR